MKKTFRFTAKKVDQAISEGLKTLGVEQHEVDINIISSGGFLKKAEVELILEVPDEVIPEPVKVVSEPAIKAEEKPAITEKPFKEQKAKQPLQKVIPVKKEESSKKLFEKFADEPIATPAFATKYADNSGETASEKKNHKSKKPNKNGNNGNGKKSSSTKDRLFAMGIAEEGEIPKAPKKRAEIGEVTEMHTERALQFLKGLLSLTEFSSDLSCSAEGGLHVNLAAESAILIGKHGDMLEAIQYLTSQIVNKDEEKYIPVVVDVLGYRAKRTVTLQNLAQKMADRCLALNRRIGLEPMSSSDRRIVHTYLDKLGGIVTRSQGFEPNRRIVIYPSREGNK